MEMDDGWRVGFLVCVTIIGMAVLIVHAIADRIGVHRSAK